jgi:hypothetical protein
MSHKISPNSAQISGTSSRRVKTTRTVRTARPSAKPAELKEGLSAEELDDQKWTQAFSASLDVLEQLADEASRDFRAGKTKPLEF